jgi:Ser/Thr protein kinase RdoA (MazF antagonist)
MAFNGELSHDELLRRLHCLAERALERFHLPHGVTLELINVSENTTFRVDDPVSGAMWALRVHREAYQSRTTIASELAWLMALKADGAAFTPTPLPGRDGELIQTVGLEGLPRPRNVVLFAWETGAEPAQNDVAGFEALGETAARMHAHVRSWQPPPWFERHTWDFATSLGDRPHWGRWQDGLGMTREVLEAFGETVGLIGRRLGRFGKAPDRFGLIHGDMRRANLLMDGRKVKVIDFDDCGFSWFLYDCATAVSFFEEKPEVPELLQAWMRGYRRAGALSEACEDEIETFVMLRRLLLVAWIGSHSETELARSMGAGYTAGTIPMCERYLSRFGEARSPAAARAPRTDGRLWRRVFG